MLGVDAKDTKKVRKQYGFRYAQSDRNGAQKRFRKIQSGFFRKLSLPKVEGREWESKTLVGTQKGDICGKWHTVKGFGESCNLPNKANLSKANCNDTKQHVKQRGEIKQNKTRVNDTKLIIKIK